MNCVIIFTVSTVLSNGVDDWAVKFRRRAQFDLLPCHTFSGL